MPRLRPGRTARIGIRWFIGAILISLIYYFILPAQLFDDPYSTVLQDASGELLSASIAADGQWRFPQTEAIPEKFTQALMAYEDKSFYGHPGVDILSMARAIRQNIEAGKIVSGGSTITMQVIRLSRRSKRRTVREKITEILLATRLELRCSKNEILSLYASHAPFGGNVVGMEAACWRYFGRESTQLSWGEAALLAVLPNSPSMIHPGRNRERLKRKRDLLLDKLLRHGIIDAVTNSLAKEETIAEAPHPLPRSARHLLARVSKEGYAGQVVRSTVDGALQADVERIVYEHHLRLTGNQIFNGAALILDVNSGDVLAYVGNTITNEHGKHGEDVDIITAKRSTGSILKPFLYAGMLDAGKILPATLLPDIPTIINGFSPQNFSRQYDGAVPANEALIRSLNVPAVHLLKGYRFEKFHTLLKGMGMRSLSQPPDHYGLALILGGAEGTLWDVSGMYGSMARTLTHYFEHPGQDKYNRRDYHEPQYIKKDDSKRVSGQDRNLEATSWLSAASIYQTFDALTEVYRPGEESGWRHFSNSKKIAWKTGTSFGFRDGWAIGVTSKYVVGVWVGNADGEGRPGLTGTDAAAPLMFDIFSRLDAAKWFARPLMEMQRISVCSQSGYRNTPRCIETDSIWVVKAGLQSLPCPNHKQIHLSTDGNFRVHTTCESLDKMKEAMWFVLPPTQEHYYKRKNLSFHSLPPFREDCEVSSSLSVMDLMYPKPGSRIYIPRELDGATGRAVFELAHHDPGVTVHWHLDGIYVGSTQKKHFLAINPTEGKHVLVLVDENGEDLEERFEVLSKM